MTLVPVPKMVHLRVNGDRRSVGVPPHWTLLETLRYGLGLTGSKQGCDKGDCGACTVILDGQPVLACLTAVWEAEGAEVTTVEGLARGPHLHPLQDEFDRKGAAQCGFCTPGILCSAAALLEQNPEASLDQVREALSGNLCRCTGYTKIFDAVLAAGERVRQERVAAGAESGRGGGHDPGDRVGAGEESGAATLEADRAGAGRGGAATGGGGAGGASTGAPSDAPAEG